MDSKINLLLIFGEYFKINLYIANSSLFPLIKGKLFINFFS